MIETERLVLRPPEEGDLLAIYRIVSDPEVMSALGSEPVGMDAAAEHLERLRARWDADGFGHFVCLRKDTGVAIGRVGLLVWDPETWEHTRTRAEIGDNAEIELGWTLERAAWGRGYATEAAAGVRDWTLEHVKPRRLISLIHPDNVRSQRVAEKIGETYRHDVVHDAFTLGLWQL